jgi:hypothetical protein
MTKQDIINQETFWNYCYNKAKNNIFKNWVLNDEEIENINTNETIVFKSFFKYHKSYSLDVELELIKKYYLNERIDEETKKCLKKYKSGTNIFIKRIEYFIIRGVI